MYKRTHLIAVAVTLSCALPLTAASKRGSSQTDQTQSAPAAKEQSPSQQQGAKTPRALLKHFGQAMKQGDSDTVQALVDQSSKQGKTAAHLMGMMASLVHSSRQFRRTVTKKFGDDGWKEIKNMPGMTFPSPEQFQSIQDKIKHAKVEVNGDTAVATMPNDKQKAKQNGEAGGGGKQSSQGPKGANQKAKKVHLVKHGGKWYVDMSKEMGNAGKAAFVGRMFAALDRQVTQATKAAQKSKSIDDLKQELLDMQKQRAAMRRPPGAKKPQPQSK